MKIFDFGKNTYHCGLAFKFDCLGADSVRNLAEHFLIRRKLFSTVSRGEPGPQAILSKGDGSEKAPYLQLKIAGNEIVLWAGWHMPYESWQQSRNPLLAEIGSQLKAVPLELVASVSSQSVLIAPLDKFKDPDDVPELKPIREFFSRFIPEELSKTGSGYVAFGDEDGKRTIEWLVGGGTVQGEQTISLTDRLNVLDSRATVEQNLLAHARNADELLEKLHSGFLALVLKG